LKLRLPLEAPTQDDSAKMSNQVPALMRGWIECLKCGRIGTPSRDFRLPRSDASPTLDKVSIVCERCGQYATLYLQRIVFGIH
jgi:ribosomal protein S14